MTPPAAQPLKTDAEFYQELIAALDALPVQELIRSDLIRQVNKRTGYCAVGAMVLKAGAVIPPNQHTNLSEIADALHCDSLIVGQTIFENDNYLRHDLPLEAQRRSRWFHMRNWAEERIRELTLTESAQS